VSLSLAWFIAQRYTRAKRRNRLVSFITFISFMAIALGVAVLVTVLSVMNGFERELRHGILSITSHITLTAFPPPHLQTNMKFIEQSLRETPGVESVAPYINGPAMIGQGKGMFLELHGVYPRRQVDIIRINDRMVAGDFLDLKKGTVVIGKELAQQLGLGVGDNVSLMISRGSVLNPNQVPRIRRFTVVGIFAVGVYEYDERVVFIHYNDAQDLLYGGAGVEILQVKTKDPFYARALAAQIRPRYEADFLVSDWTHRYYNLFRAVKQQKGIMFIILSLIVAVAAFSIVTSLIMVVKDKSSEIAILRTIGARPGLIMQIFIIQGFIIGVVGTLIGLVAGILLSDNIGYIVSGLEMLLQMKLLPGEVYYISHLSGEKHWNDIGNVALTAFLICLLATVYPSWKAANTKPAESLKFE